MNLAALSAFVLPLLASVAAATGQAPQTAPSPVLLRVQVTREGPLATVTLEARGPLPSPQVGQVEAPERIYLDLPGVVPKTRGARPPGDPVVQRVRVALHSGDPLVTRAVIDLTGRQPFRVEADDRNAGRLRVIIGTAGTPPAPSGPTTTQTTAPAMPIALAPKTLARPAVPRPDSPPAARPDAPAAAAPPFLASTPVTPIPEKDAAEYRSQIAEALARMIQLRNVLASIDRMTNPASISLEAAADEFDSIRRLIAAAPTPAALRSTQELLMRACALGAMAARLRAEANRTSDLGHVRNASSAAAGALLLLDRGCAELGCGAR